MKKYIIVGFFALISFLSFAKTSLGSDDTLKQQQNGHQAYAEIVSDRNGQSLDVSSLINVEDGASDSWYVYIILAIMVIAAYFLVLNNKTALKLTLKQQILSVSASFIILLLCLSVYNARSMNSLGGEIESIAHEDIVMTEYITEVEKHALKQEIVMQKILTLAHDGVYKNLKVIEELENKFRELSIELDEHLEEAQVLCQYVLGHESNQVQLKEFTYLLKQIGNIAKIHEHFEEQAEVVFAAVNKNNQRELAKLESAIEQEGAAIADSTEVLLTGLETFTENSANMALAHEKSALNNNIIISIIAILLATFFSILLANKISNQLGGEPHEVEFLSQKMGVGDLAFDMTKLQNRTGAIGSLVDMVNKMKQVIGTIKTGAGNIAAASQQLSSSSQVISTGVNEQAASSEEVGSSMEEMASNILQNTQNARETRNMSGKASNAMEQVAVASDDSMKAVKDIYAKIGVVVEIAEKTDLLAINAAVEAARAGDQGRGFAVVAAEVRKLAERSQLAANEIVELAQRGMTLTEDSTNMLKGIVPDIQKTSQLIDEIATASQEQDAGAAQVNTAVQQLSMVTQQNASAAEEMSSSSEEMAAQATELEEITQMFKLDNNSTNGQANMAYKSVNKMQGESSNNNGHMTANGQNGQAKFNIDMGGFENDLKGFEQM